MLSKTQSKYINSLSISKFRKQYQHFIVEGAKMCLEWLQSAEQIQYIVAEEDWLTEHSALCKKHIEATIIPVSKEELKKISQLQTPNQALIVSAIPQTNPQLAQNGWQIALDGIRDPGNMGTILRIADWYGIQQVYCSNDCVDVLNSKVVQAGMGAHLRVQIITGALSEFILNSNLPSYAATLHGSNIYTAPKSQQGGIIVIGNEAMGISDDIIDICTHTITIPRIGKAESLNAAVSTGIICALLAGQ